MSYRFRSELLLKGLSVLFLSCLANQVVIAQKELQKSASWSVPARVDTVRILGEWLDETEATPEERLKIENALVRVLGSQAESRLTLDQLATLIVEVRSEPKAVLDAIQSGDKQKVFSALEELNKNVLVSEWVKDQIGVMIVRWLARNELYDEALELIAQSDLRVEGLLTPDVLLFYQGVAQHQLLQQEQSVKTLSRLLENEKQIPKRFSVVSRLMVADIQQMEPDSLDQIARMMADIKRRQNLYRSGKRVRAQEEEVIRKLDKMIEEMQKQQQQQVAQAQLVPSSPMQDSQSVSGKGAGEVTNRRVSDGADWGNLPPAKRAAALAEMAKDLPPHYRAVIEEYFKKLADEDN